jgi:hypothetical protein
MRSKAEHLKKDRQKIATGAVKSIGGVSTVLGRLVPLYKLYLSAAESGIVFCNQVVTNPELRGKSVTLVSNVVHDAANRINELANIVEAAKKNSAISKAFAATAESMTNLKDSFKGKKKRHNPFKVVAFGKNEFPEDS